MNKTIIIFIILLLEGCCVSGGSRPPKFSPESLPLAKVGSYYNVKIKNSGANIGLMWLGNKEPYESPIILNNGLSINTHNPQDNWEIIIQGIAKRKGTESFTVNGLTSGTQCPGGKFSKKFTIITIEAD